MLEENKTFNTCAPGGLNMKDTCCITTSCCIKVLYPPKKMLGESLLRPYRLYLYSSILASGRERVQLAEASVHQPDRPQEERERGSSDRICRRNHAPHFRHQAS